MTDTKTNIIIVLVIICIILIYFIITKKEDFVPFEALTEYKYLKENITLLKTLIDVLDKNDITYWAIGGTLIGAVRDKGFIPWDDDTDLSVKLEDINKIMKNQELKDLGIEIIERNGWYKAYSINGKKTKYPFNYPSIDLFTVVENDNGDYVYSSEYCRQKWPDVYKIQELFPLQKYPFEDFYIYAMNNPYNFLDEHYPSWRTHGMKYYDHVNEKKLPKQEFAVDYDKYKKPYLWTYWDNLDGKQTPAFINLCYKTMIKNCDESFDIVQLNKDNIEEYLPEVKEHRKYIEKLRIAHKTDFYRVMLLYKYGGLWLDADTIVLRDPIEVINKTIKYDYVGFGCTGNNCKYGYGKPSNGIMASRSTSMLMGKTLKCLLEKIRTNQKFEYFDLGKLIIWKELENLINNQDYEYYHYKNKFDGTRDKNGNWVTTDIMFSDQKVEYDLNKDEKMLFYILYNSEIKPEIKNMSEKEILATDWNVSKYIKQGLA